MKLIRLSGLMLATGLFIASCGEGKETEETTDTTEMPAVQPGTDTAVHTGDGTGNNADESMNNANAPADNSTSAPDANGQPATGTSAPATGAQKTDMSKVPGSGHPGDNPPKEGHGSPNQ